MTCVTTERLSDPPSVCRYNVLPAPSLNRPFLYAPYKATMKLVSPKLLHQQMGAQVRHLSEQIISLQQQMTELHQIAAAETLARATSAAVDQLGEANSKARARARACSNAPLFYEPLD